MRRETARNRTALLVPFVLALALPVSRAAVPVQDASASSPTKSAIAPAPVYRALSRLREKDYQTRLDAIASEQPMAALAACVLRAGRAAPPVVTATRRTEREGMQADALGWLRGRLEGPERATWITNLRALLRDPGSESLGNRRNAEEIWDATARTIGFLRLDELAEELALSLDDDRPVRQAAARAALFDLHVRWYEDLADFMARHADGSALCDDPRYYDELRGKAELARTRLGEILRLDPQRAFLALGDEDPAVRADAARALGRGATDGRVDRVAAFEQLIEHAEDEVVGTALHVALESLISMQAGAAPDAPGVKSLRLLLGRLILADYPSAQASVSQACAQLPVAFAVESGGARVDQMLFLLDDQLGALVAQDGLVDDDAMLACLRAALGLCDRARAGGVVFGDELNRLRDHLFEVLQWSDSFREVRQAAAQVLGRLTRPQDLVELAEAMERRRDDSELVYGMIGPLADAAAAADPADPGAQLALELLIDWCSHNDVDLRGRAIASVADERLAPLTSGVSARRFVDQLSRESVPDLQRALLGLLERHGSAADGRGILELPNFDALVIGNPALVASMVRTLGVLANGDHELLFQSADRLLRVDEPATRVRRLGDAIRMMASLSNEEAQLLAREQHAALVEWAMELRAAGGALVTWDEPSICAAFLQRLTALHVPRSLEPGAQPTGAQEHRLALLLSDLNTLLPGTVPNEEILGHFERALADATARPDAGLSTAIVLRDRARFHLENESPSLARDDYRALFALDDGADTARLDLRDLRAAGELIELVPVNPAAPSLADREAAREAFGVSQRLVERPAWTSETAGLRLADLVDLAERARWSRDADVLRSALAAFDGLPPAAGETPPQAPAGAPWAGLASDPARLAKLLAERDALAELHGLIPTEAAAGETTTDSTDATEDARDEPESGDTPLPPPETPPPGPEDGSDPDKSSGSGS
ncbi:MAG: hypothetical protein H6831_15540 [Planctomycetes bacterium]|nr:hypothetical protein [Planctomycetota bacterium]MCB9905811.1 hypothetical protein [Planctomycetota bacterium]